MTHSEKLDKDYRIQDAIEKRAASTWDDARCEVHAQEFIDERIKEAPEVLALIMRELAAVKYKATHIPLSVRPEDRIAMLDYHSNIYNVLYNILDQYVQAEAANYVE